MMKKYMTKQQLQELSAAVGEAERGTSGQIRVVLRHRRHWNERRLSMHELALKEFRRLKMHNTRERTGVLILLLYSERKFHILADEGLHTKVTEGTWDRLAEGMSGHFREGKFVAGITHAIRAVGTELARHYPRRSDSTNELPDDVVER